ncbi:MAG TPA: hypothetical protein VK977_08445, partial [Actinomycetota bacterium]|nr:hypothetical protein [Actinomycetota bacterium]
DALARMRTERWLVAARSLELESEGRRVSFRGGALVRRGDERGFDWPVPPEAADEVRVAATWLAGRPVRVITADVPAWEPLDGGHHLARLRGLLNRPRE